MEKKRTGLYLFPSMLVILAIILVSISSPGGVSLETGMTIRGNNVTVIEGLHQINGSIIVEENATLILRNATLNFTTTQSYQFEIKLQNPRGGTPRIIIENSEIITTGDHRLEIRLFDNSTAKITGLTMPEDIQINTHYTASLEIADSEIQGTIRGRWNSSCSITNATIHELEGNDNTQIHVANSEITGSLLCLVKNANATIQGLGPGHVEHWELHENLSTMHLPGVEKPTIIVQDTEVRGFRLHISDNSNATIKSSDLRKITATSNSQVWIHDTHSEHGITTFKDATVHAYNSSFGPSTAIHNATLYFTNCTTGYHSFQDRSQKTECFYLELTAQDPENTTIPNATITVVHPNTTTIAIKTTDTSGKAWFILASGTTNSTGHFPIGPYKVTAAHLTYRNQALIEMDGNKKHTMTLPIPVPETAWIPCLTIAPLIILITKRSPTSRTVKTGKPSQNLTWRSGSLWTPHHDLNHGESKYPASFASITRL